MRERWSNSVEAVLTEVELAMSLAAKYELDLSVGDIGIGSGIAVRHPNGGDKHLLETVVHETNGISGPNTFCDLSNIAGALRVSSAVDGDLMWLVVEFEAVPVGVVAGQPESESVWNMRFFAGTELGRAHLMERHVIGAAGAYLAEMHNADSIRVCVAPHERWAASVLVQAGFSRREPALA